MNATTTRAAWVKHSNGCFYRQIPADNRWGFILSDGELTYEGGLGLGKGSWEIVDAALVPANLRNLFDDCATETKRTRYNEPWSINGDALKDRDGRTIAEFFVGDDAAIGRLCAAAPALLEACKAMLGIDNAEATAPGHIDYTKAVKMARAAIAHASDAIAQAEREG